jgi:glucan 1,3-beta-glucosidase
MLIEGDGPNWLWGTAFEHTTLFDYQVANARNIFMGHIQHETAYFQGNPRAEVPFAPQTSWNDPLLGNCGNINNCPKTWALRVVNSEDIRIYGAGFYSFFNNWDAGEQDSSDNHCTTG